MPSIPTPLLLLKTRSQPTDPYEVYFSKHPFHPTNGEDSILFQPIFVPVLQHRQINLDLLESAITSGKLGQDLSRSEKGQETGYGALIVTSQRAVEALGSVLDRVKANPAWQSRVSSLLAHTTVYVVGPATATAITKLGFTSANVLGTECGNGEVLARFILGSYNSTSSPVKRPILFLVGETRRDTIPRTLHDAPGVERIEVEEMVIYETTVEEGFRKEFTKIIEDTYGRKRWICVFSPAGADIAVNILKEHRESEKERGSYIATIGPTTEKCLTDTLNHRPEVVAERPSPEGLWEAITGFIKTQGSQN